MLKFELKEKIQQYFPANSITEINKREPEHRSRRETITYSSAMQWNEPFIQISSQLLLFLARISDVSLENGITGDKIG